MALTPPRTHLEEREIRVVAGLLAAGSQSRGAAVVLPDHGAERERKVDCLSAHLEHVIPVLLKRGRKKWAYVGRYRREQWSDDPGEIKADPADRLDAVYHILFSEGVRMNSGARVA